MVTIINYRQNQSKDGRAFISLELQGDPELIQSQNTGKFYLTAKRCFITSTFDEAVALRLIGTSLKGSIQKVDVAAYQFTVPETGEVIMLTHRYEYVPEQAHTSVPVRGLTVAA